MATTGHEPRPGQTSSAGGVPTSGISPATTTAAMTGGTPGVSTNPADSKTDTNRSTSGAGTAATNPYTPDSARSGMSSGDMARAASATGAPTNASSTSGSSANTPSTNTSSVAGAAGTTAGGTTTSGASTSSREEIRQEVRQTGETVKEEARRAANALKDEARQTMRDVASRQKEAAAGEMSGLSRALQKAADELEGQTHLPVDRYVRRAAQSLDDLSESLRRRDVDSVVNRMEQFAREQPALVIGGAVAIGFLLARMLRGPAEASSSDTSYPNDVYH